MGIFLVVYASYSLHKDDFSVSPTAANAVIGGGLSGFLAGLIGTGGALRGAFLTGFKLPKEKYIATAAAMAMAVDLTRIPVYVSEGFLKREYYWYLPILLAVALTGSFAGKKIVSKIPQKIFRKFVLAMIIAIGVKFIYDWMMKK